MEQPRVTTVSRTCSAPIEFTVARRLLALERARLSKFLAALFAPEQDVSQFVGPMNRAPSRSHASVHGGGDKVHDEEADSETQGVHVLPIGHQRPFRDWQCHPYGVNGCT